MRLLFAVVVVIVASTLWKMEPHLFHHSIVTTSTFLFKPQLQLNRKLNTAASGGEIERYLAVFLN